MTLRLGLVLVAVCALGTGCGDDAPKQPPTGMAGAKPLTPEEMAKAMRESGRFNEDSIKAAEAAVKTMQEQMGGEDVMEMAAKAKALSERPLTAADIETWIAVVPKTRLLAGKPKELSAALSGSGLSIAEWGVLNSRISAALMGLHVPKDKVNAKMAADVETIRPYEAKIQAATKSR